MYENLLLKKQISRENESWQELWQITIFNIVFFFLKFTTFHKTFCRRYGLYESIISVLLVGLFTSWFAGNASVKQIWMRFFIGLAFIVQKR